MFSTKAKVLVGLLGSMVGIAGVGIYDAYMNMKLQQYRDALKKLINECEQIEMKNADLLNENSSLKSGIYASEHVTKLNDENYELALKNEMLNERLNKGECMRCYVKDLGSMCEGVDTVDI